MRGDRSHDRQVATLFERAIALGTAAREAIARDDGAEADRRAGELRLVVQRLARLLAREDGPLSGHVGALHHYTAERLGAGRADAATLRGIVADLGALREARRALLAHAAAAPPEGASGAR